MFNAKKFNIMFKGLSTRYILVKRLKQFNMELLDLKKLINLNSKSSLIISKHKLHDHIFFLKSCNTSFELVFFDNVEIIIKFNNFDKKEKTKLLFKYDKEKNQVNLSELSNHLFKPDDSDLTPFSNFSIAFCENFIEISLSLGDYFGITSTLKLIVRKNDELFDIFQKYSVISKFMNYFLDLEIIPPDLYKDVSLFRKLTQNVCEFIYKSDDFTDQQTCYIKENSSLQLSNSPLNCYQFHFIHCNLCECN